MGNRMAQSSEDEIKAGCNIAIAKKKIDAIDL
jgi:hypothetical protein